MPLAFPCFSRENNDIWTEVVLCSSNWHLLSDVRSSRLLARVNESFRMISEWFCIWLAANFGVPLLVGNLLWLESLNLIAVCQSASMEELPPDKSVARQMYSVEAYPSVLSS